MKPRLPNIPKRAPQSRKAPPFTVTGRRYRAKPTPPQYELTIALDSSAAERTSRLASLAGYARSCPQAFDRYYMRAWAHWFQFHVLPGIANTRPAIPPRLTAAPEGG